MIWNDSAIAKWAAAGGITPFVPQCVRVNDNGEKVISYGLQSFGYDIRLARQFRVFQMPLDHSGVVNPKDFNVKLLREFEGDVCIIPPNSFALACSVEYFKMPPNVTGLVLGKSTYARCGVIINVTPFEPEWEGHATIEISNTTPLPALIYGNEGIGQLIFFRGEPPTISYADRKGKYQSQPASIVMAKV